MEKQKPTDMKLYLARLRREGASPRLKNLRLKNVPVVATE
jgi:hypothetical protein